MFFDANNIPVTFITGFWHVSRNVKRDISHYLRLIPSTMELVESNPIVCFHDGSEYEGQNFGARVRAVKDEGVSEIVLSMQDLPTYEMSKFYLDACRNQDTESLRKISCEREKGVKHCDRELGVSGPDSYRKVFSIWTSKPFLVLRVIKAHPASEYYAWIDASASRFDVRNRQHDFRALKLESNFIYHYSNLMKFRGRAMAVNASVMIAHKDAWRVFAELFERELVRNKYSAYAHDEETLIQFIVEEFPQLFKSIDKF